MLPVGVLIPTRNSMAFLPRHVETMRHWLDLAQEIVVVDSESRDGTVQFLRAKLPADKTRFFKHPPGLYQSWNFGVQQVSAQHTYVSTVGDEISREGFAHLAEVAERFSSDVVISPPGFVDEAGRPAHANHWPVHRIISHLNLQRETCLEGIVPFLVALTFLPFAILGSSASNLYRTTVLQENPRFEHIIGVRVSDTTAEARMVTLNVTANSRNRRPTISLMNNKGIRTAIRETVNETMVKPICAEPFSAASRGASPASM